MHRLTMAAVGNLESVGNKLFALREWRFGRVREKLICILRSYWWWQRQVSGDAAYENYVRRAARCSSGHAGCGHDNAEKIASAEQFYLERLHHEHSRVNRCC